MASALYTKQTDGSFSQRSSNHASELWSMQRELDNSRSQAESHRRDLDTARQGESSQVNQWKERCTQLEREAENARDQLGRANRSLSENDVSRPVSHATLESMFGTEDGLAIQSAEAIKELQNELIILMEELKAVSTRNEELLAERDEDAEVIRRLEADTADYKRKWETTRTQLRNLKGKFSLRYISRILCLSIMGPLATSTMFVSKPITDDHMPASIDGNIADVHVTAFQSAIDNLLAIARYVRSSYGNIKIGA